MEQEQSFSCIEHGNLDVDPEHLIVRAYSLIHDGPVRLDPAEAELGRFVSAAQVERTLLTEPTTSWLEPTWALCREHLILSPGGAP